MALLSGLVLGVVWAGFAAWLAADGHQPTMARGLPVPADRYYATAAMYLAPLWLALTLLTAAVAHGAARMLGGSGRWRSTLSAVGPAYTLPLLVVYLIPDIVVYATVGHGGLAVVLRFGLPLAVAGVTVRTTQAVSAAHGLGIRRALVAALVAGLVQAAPFGLLIR